MAQRFEFIDRGEHRLDVYTQAQPRRGAEPPAGQPLQEAAVRGECGTFDGAGRVEHGVQRAAGDFARVELLERAGGRVARVHEGLAAGLLFAPVELGEAGAAHVDLAADFQQRRRVCESERDGAERLDVGGDVIADLAVAARRSAYECAVFVEQREGDAVNLRLDHIVPDVIRNLAPQEGVEIQQVRAGMGLVQAHHRRVVADLAEGGKRCAADALRGRVGRDPFGMRAFQRLQFAVESVIVGIADFRARLDIVEAVVASDRLAQVIQAFKRHERKEELGIRI